MPFNLERTLAYHQRTKHGFSRYARGPARLDGATQPNPCRRYDGAPLVALEPVPAGDSPGLPGASWPPTTG